MYSSEIHFSYSVVQVDGAYDPRQGSHLRTAWALLNSIIWLIFFGTAVLFCFTLIPILGLTKVQRLVWRIACMYFRVCLWACSASYVVVGLENLDPEASYVFACNHQSGLDIPLAFAAFPFWLISVAKSSVAYMPIFGWAVALGGTIFIRRANHDRALESLQNGCTSLRKRPRSIVA